MPAARPSRADHEVQRHPLLVRRARVHTFGALFVLTTGLLLLVFMVTVESEPGALPLLLIAVGAGWLFAAWRSRRGSLG